MCNVPIPSDPLTNSGYFPFSSPSSSPPEDQGKLLTNVSRTTLCSRAPITVPSHPRSHIPGRTKASEDFIGVWPRTSSGCFQATCVTYRSQFRTADTVCFASSTGTQVRACRMADVVLAPNGSRKMQVYDIRTVNTYIA